MLPTVAIVGRPNVGKSTLFNRLVRRRHALVADEAGLTRDRHYQIAEWEGRRFLLVDTGGFESDRPQGLEAQIRLQTEMAIEEADLVIFVADARAGATTADIELIGLLRCSAKPVLHLANKVDGPQLRAFEAELYALGVPQVFSVSAEHGLGIDELIDAILEHLPPQPVSAAAEPGDDQAEAQGIRLALVGRPNAGKSALLNCLVGSERAIVSEVPGTTRDPIDAVIESDVGRFTLVDTAGIRRKRRAAPFMEQLAVLRAERTVDQADVVALVIDSSQPISTQDAKIAARTIDAGRALVLVFSKSDLAGSRQSAERRIKEGLADHLAFAGFAPHILLSARTGARVDRLLPLVREVYDAAGRRVATAEINRVLGQIVENYAPPVHQGRPMRILFATQTGTRPPTIVLSVSNPEGIPQSYRRYLLKRFREELGFSGTPLRLIFRARHRRP